MDRMPKLNTFKVEVDGKSMEVLIPDTGDRQENAYLEEAEREKTLDQLKKKRPREKTKLSKEEQAIAIKDFKRYNERKKINNIPRYFSVNYSS